MKNKSRTIIKLSNKLLFSIFILEMISISALATMDNPQIVNTIVLATTVQPEKFTELYFENHLNLPKNIEVNKENSFAFTIHNLEGKDTNYRYEVYKEINGKKEIIATGEFTLQQNQSKTIPQSFALINEDIKAKIVVNLINKDQQIAFWIQGIHEKLQ